MKYIKYFLLGVFFLLSSCNEFQLIESSSLYKIYKNNNTYEVYFSNSLSDENSYLSLFNLIQSSSKDSVINLHLSGYGGDWECTLRFFNVIKKSKATINTIVEGPVYSAFAALAMAGDHITINPNTFLMFHEPAAYLTDGEVITLEESCNVMKGHTDRGQDAYTKCMQQVYYTNKLSVYIEKTYIFPYFTSEQIYDFNTGKDTYILGDDLKIKLKNKGS